MQNKLLVTALAGLVLFVACSKKDSPTPKPPATDSTAVPDSVALLGNWRPIHDATAYYLLSGQWVSSDSIVLQPDDYYDFKDGKMYYFDHDFGDPNYDTMPLDAFVPMVQRVMARPKRSIYMRKDQSMAAE